MAGTSPTMTANYFPAVFCLPSSGSRPSVRPGNPATSNYRCEPTLWNFSTVFSPFAEARELTLPLDARSVAPFGMFGHHAAEQGALRPCRETHKPGGGGADVGIADRQIVDIARLEIRAGRRHEIHRVAAAEAAVHALSLAQHRVGNLDGAIGRLVASGLFRALNIGSTTFVATSAI